MSETYEDKWIVCCDCKEEFEFTAGEQKFFFTKGFSTPKRCKECKAKKRAASAGVGGGREY